MSTTAIVLAAGESRRMHGMGDKVLLPLAGLPVVVHSLLTLQQENLVQHIVLVTAERLAARMGSLVHEHAISKVAAIVPGGSTRQESVWLGLGALPHSTTSVIVHDAARPCLDERDLRQVMADALRHGASILAVPVKDTIKIVSDHYVADTPERSTLWAAQTPQVFERHLLVSGHLAALKQDVDATDDAALVSRLGHKVHVTLGSYSNIKITTPDDMIIAETYLDRRRKQRWLSE